jgi:hypothetical protein
MARSDVQLIENAAVSEASSYVAFISYHHTDNTDEDRKWGTWLHHRLEIYDIPAELIGTRNSQGRIIPERLYPVFRDEVSLPADADLTRVLNSTRQSISTEESAGENTARVACRDFHDRFVWCRCVGGFDCNLYEEQLDSVKSRSHLM